MPDLDDPAASSTSTNGRSTSLGLVYEELLNRDSRWALSEGGRHFEGESAVFQSLHSIAARLNNLAIPYAVVGGIALFHHGLRRFTEDINILVTREDLKIIHAKLDGLGYLPPFVNRKKPEGYNERC